MCLEEIGLLVHNILTIISLIVSAIEGIVYHLMSTRIHHNITHAMR
jgi:hypothetical protein